MTMLGAGCRGDRIDVRGDYSVCNMCGRSHADDSSLGGWWGARTCMGLCPGWLAERWEVPGSGGRARRESSEHVRDGRCSRDGHAETWAACRMERGPRELYVGRGEGVVTMCGLAVVAMVADRVF